MTNPRARLLLVKAFLEERTDELHPAAVPELIAYLERRGMAADRRAVYRDLALLRESGMQIAVRRGRGGGFFLKERLFEPAELRLLADMVRRSRILTQARTDAILNKLGSLTSGSAAAALTAKNRAFRKRKANSEDVLVNVGRIFEALESGRQLSFVYRQGGMQRPGVCRGAQTYTVNPMLVLCADGMYYLAADCPLQEGLMHYRADRMQKVRVLAEPSAAAAPAANPEAYERSVFSAEQGERRWVRLAFEKTLLDEMKDRFGADAPLAEIDEKTGSVCAGVCVSPAFFGWVFQFGGRVRILAPDDVRETMSLMAENCRQLCRHEAVRER